MEKHFESVKRFGKEDGGTAAKNEILESFIRDSGDKAYRVAYSLSGNPEEAKELVQEALYRAARAWKQYEVRKPLDGWFFTILRNAFLDSRGRYESRKGVSLDTPVGGDEDACLADLLAPGEDSTLRELEQAETVETVRRVLGSLDKKHRAVLELCDMGGAGYEDAARALRLPLGTVRSRLFRARQAFRVNFSAPGERRRGAL